VGLQEMAALSWLLRPSCCKVCCSDNCTAADGIRARGDSVDYDGVLLQAAACCCCCRQCQAGPLVSCLLRALQRIDERIDTSRCLVRAHFNKSTAPEASIAGCMIALASLFGYSWPHGLALTSAYECMHAHSIINENNAKGM
jgi:hypothetical protein